MSSTETTQFYPSKSYYASFFETWDILYSVFRDSYKGNISDETLKKVRYCHCFVHPDLVVAKNKLKSIPFVWDQIVPFEEGDYYARDIKAGFDKIVPMLAETGHPNVFGYYKMSECIVFTEHENVNPTVIKLRTGLNTFTFEINLYKAVEEFRNRLAQHLTCILK